MPVRVQLTSEARGKFAELNAFPPDTIFEVGEERDHPLGPPYRKWFFLVLNGKTSKDPLSAKHFCVVEE